MRASTGADEWGIAIAPGGDAEAPRPACAPPIVAQGGRAHIGGYWHRSITEILVVTRVVLGAFFAAQYGIFTYVLDNGYRGDSACVQKMHEDTARISLFSLGMEAVTMLALSVILYRIRAAAAAMDAKRLRRMRYAFYSPLVVYVAHGLPWAVLVVLALWRVNTAAWCTCDDVAKFGAVSAACNTREEMDADGAVHVGALIDSWTYTTTLILILSHALSVVWNIVVVIVRYSVHGSVCMGTRDKEKNSV